MSSELHSLSLDALSERFKRFAMHPDLQCPLYRRLSWSIAADPELLALAAHVRIGQPIANLFFAAVHFLLLKGTHHPLSAFYPSISQGEPRVEDPYPSFRSFCLTHQEAVMHLIATRNVQTNEIGRCACLLPAFGLVASQAQGHALSLVEIGASAGLNLLWDRYGYDYGAGRRSGMSNPPVQLACTLRGNRFPPISPSLPPIAWRVGLDLTPIKVDDVEATLWLRALIWPEQRERIKLLTQALQVAQQEPPPLVTGDALSLLAPILATVPEETVLCVFHSFTVNQFSPEARTRLTSLLAAHARRRPLYRVSLEWDEQEHTQLRLTVFENGLVSERLLAFCDSHGRWLEWLVINA